MIAALPNAWIIHELLAHDLIRLNTVECIAFRIRIVHKKSLSCEVAKQDFESKGIMLCLSKECSV